MTTHDRPRYEVGFKADDRYGYETDDRQIDFKLGAGYKEPTVSGSYTDYLCLGVEDGDRWPVASFSVHVDDEAEISVRHHRYPDGDKRDFVSVDLGGGVDGFFSPEKAVELALALLQAKIVDHPTDSEKKENA